TLFFLDADQENFKNLLQVLEVFCSISSLCINMAKSTLLGINVDEELVHSLADSSGCKVGNWPIKYLGMPLGGNPRKFDFWELVVAKVSKRIDGWKRAFLSRCGRLTLIQSVLYSIPIYYLSIFKAPCSVTELLENMQDFFWEGDDQMCADHLVAWDVLCHSKMQDGLRIGKVSTRNRALLMKWL
ncbi:hypothetical protein PanWU01x14_369730, partial [Parasponia andersonii]